MDETRPQHQHPSIGDTVTVWPDPALRVLPREIEGLDRRLPVEGKDVTWSRWLEGLFRRGRSTWWTRGRGGVPVVVGARSAVIGFQ